MHWNILNQQPPSLQLNKMKTIFFALPGNELLAKTLSEKCNAESGDLTIRRFPDGETFVKINSEVTDKRVILVCTLNQPDAKFLPLIFLSKTAKDLGAREVCLVAPYLAYMRQDKRFYPGEGITSHYFASLLSSSVDRLITIDPHLHRTADLSEIYSIPTQVLHADHLISNWIKNNISNPVLVGPDSESEQWVAEVAKNANAPFVVLQKTRKGDKEVEVSIPHLEKYTQHTPVLVDDIISTARTMIETVKHLKKLKMKAPVCIGVHAVFSENAYEDLMNEGISKIITCTTIPHASNEIDICGLLATAIS
jgi:ribose-phosphate pyrophosphokinase